MQNAKLKEMGWKESLKKWVQERKIYCINVREREEEIEEEEEGSYTGKNERGLNFPKEKSSFLLKEWILFKFKITSRPSCLRHLLKRIGGVWGKGRGRRRKRRKEVVELRINQSKYQWWAIYNLSSTYSWKTVRDMYMCYLHGNLKMNMKLKIKTLHQLVFSFLENLG